jgi:hypothetical protein
MIDKITFCDVLEKLRTQMYLDKKNGDAIQEMFGCGSRCSYNDNLLVQAIMSLLHFHFPKDDEGFCRIEHYIFYLEFGKIGSKEIIPAEDLYDVLVIEANK